ncbi:SufD family Fe-S cluster assembly protein [Candidatus Micrarchaeota archaeon]|nr:SufD family Fe-S cluster assembly protein [Candidatus Micrarchaeota archaeon]
MENQKNQLSITEESVAQFSKSAKEPSWLTNRRIEAIKLFETLPIENSPLFKKYASSLELNLDNMQLQQQPQNLPAIDGIAIMPISNAIQSHEKLIRQYIDKAPDNKFSALNLATFTNGYFIHIPKNTAIELPISLLNSPENLPYIAAKNLIIAEEGSNFTLTEENYSHSQKGAVVSSSTCAHAKEKASISLNYINSFNDKSSFICDKEILLEKNSKSFSSSGYFGGKQTISTQNTIMQGENSFGEDYGVIFGSNDERYSVTSNITNLGKNSKGKVVSKGVYRDGSKGLFKGMATIGKDAKNSISYLAGHSILLGKNSSSDAIPGLKIDTNDVKATHSASIAQIDESQLFYLMSRGLSLDDSNKLVVEGFLSPVLSQIKLKAVAYRIRALFELMWERKPFAQLHGHLEGISKDDSHSSDKKDLFEGHYKYRK